MYARRPVNCLSLQDIGWKSKGYFSCCILSINCRQQKREQQRSQVLMGSESDNESNQKDECSDGNSDLEEKIQEWNLRVRTVVGPSNAPDSIAALAFDPTYHQWLATGGIARKIRLYDFNSLLDSQDCYEGEEEDKMEIDRNITKNMKRRKFSDNDLYIDHKSCIEAAVICTSAKLNSLKWDPASGEQVIASGDYDSVVTEWDVETGLATFERDEHGGRRVWSVDYSQLNNSLCASASDDGTVQMWDKRSTETVMVLSALSKKPVCCAEFSADNECLLAMSCSDHRVYIYDTRKMVSSSDSALLTLHHHSRPASYVRFFGEKMVVSASIDGSLKLWDISKSTEGLVMPVRTYRGHSNRRNFVGLSVWQEGGLLACGSETNQVFAYDFRWGSPIWLQDFDDTKENLTTATNVGILNATEDLRRRGQDIGFVSGVCWRQKPCDCTLVAANSDGMLQVINGERKPHSR